MVSEGLRVGVGTRATVPGCIEKTFNFLLINSETLLNK
jgi:hypothetical protein